MNVAGLQWCFECVVSVRVSGVMERVRVSVFRLLRVFSAMVTTAFLLMAMVSMVAVGVCWWL